MQIVKTYPAFLQKEIKLFYSVIATAEEHRNIVHRRLPDGTLDIVFNLGEPVYISGNGNDFIQMPQVSLTGLYHDKRFLCYKGNVHLTGIVFNPGFAHLFIKNSLRHHTASTIDASLIFGNNINFIIEQMHSIGKEEEKHLLLEKFLQSHLRKQKDEYYLSRMQHTVEHIHLSNGNIEVKNLCNAYFISERNFRRKFSEYVGIAPKKYASIIRIKSFCKLYAFQTTSYKKIAHELEYTDKPHLYKDFHKITGTDPTSYFTQLNTLGNKFIDLI